MLMQVAVTSTGNKIFIQVSDISSGFVLGVKRLYGDVCLPASCAGMAVPSVRKNTGSCNKQHLFVLLYLHKHYPNHNNPNCSS